MKKLFQDASSLTYADIEKKKDTKKDGAQKFYSLLVLQKVRSLWVISGSLRKIIWTLFTNIFILLFFGGCFFLSQSESETSLIEQKRQGLLELKYTIRD